MITVLKKKDEVGDRRLRGFGEVEAAGAPRFVAATCRLRVEEVRVMEGHDGEEDRQPSGTFAMATKSSHASRSELPRRCASETKERTIAISVTSNDDHDAFVFKGRLSAQIARCQAARHPCGGGQVDEKEGDARQRNPDASRCR